jgi:hypothetical protein
LQPRSNISRKALFANCTGTAWYVSAHFPISARYVVDNRYQAEWGQVLFGRVLVSAVDENGRHQVTELGFGDIWYFPKGQAHTVQGLDDENEYLLAFDDADFDRAGYVSSHLPAPRSRKRY